jgi:hypothetical protein
LRGILADPAADSLSKGFFHALHLTEVEPRE